ncbi:uncharacterized protein LOC113300566 [Papaver somniferum]|uniref:uncharacterized protein LOC113300566 n=1 Tax=Papaver somniferum TaxID=3469 RepID=UPI000E70587A|nr:uncharacterized protein LOC113300566 [Papaver somniferum]XP_026405556.1 uncharacterized protein LOC113300566 [Papaver somniferum]
MFILFNFKGRLLSKQGYWSCTIITLVDKGIDPIPIDQSLEYADYHGQKLVLSQEIRFVGPRHSSFSCLPSDPSNEEINILWNFYTVILVFLRISLFIKDLSLEFSAVKSAGENEAGILIEGHNVHEQVMSFGPDGLEDGQFGDHDVDHRPLCCDLVTDSNTSFKQTNITLILGSQLYVVVKIKSSRTLMLKPVEKFSNLITWKSFLVKYLMLKTKWWEMIISYPDSPLSCISPNPVGYRTTN